MSGTQTVTMGDRGRLVIPVEVRERLGLRTGDRLVLLEEDGHLVLLTRDQLRRRVQDDFAGAGDLVGELVAGRRAASALEDVGRG